MTKREKETVKEIKKSLDAFYLADLTNAYDNYKKVKSGCYLAIIKDAYFEDSVLNIGILYMTADEKDFKSIVAKYYMSGKSRNKSLTMLLPVIYRVLNSSVILENKPSEKPCLTFDISDEMLVDTLKFIANYAFDVKVVMTVSEENPYKNVRLS